MITLGIETSCDETSVAVLEGRAKILANVVFSSLKQHQPYGGVVPEIASRSHLEVLLPVLKMALKKARVTLRDIDLVAVTKGPGLMGSVLVGLAAAKALAFSLRKPLIGVDHVLAASSMADGCLTSARASRNIFATSTTISCVSTSQSRVCEKW